MEPGRAEPPRLPGAEVRQADEQPPAGGEQLAGAREIGRRVHDVLQRMLEDDDVVRAAQAVGGGGERPDLRGDAALARLRRRGLRRIEARHLPPQPTRDDAEVAASAADVEQTPARSLAQDVEW